MKIIKVSGTGVRRELAEYVQAGLEDSWLLALERGEEDEEPATGKQIEEWLGESGLADDAPVVLETNESFSGLGTSITVFVTDAPLGALEPEVRAAGDGAELVVVEAGQAFATDGDKGLEAAVKEATGARKVLIYFDEEGRDRAFAKALDMTRASLGEDKMPDDIPQNLIDAVKSASVEGRMTCEAAHDLARELDLPLATVGRALDLLHVKITRCELGCF
ncbi:MAG: hypothetical protein ACYC99_12105 [Candidatus Geothermincolia bacterium]